MKGRRFSQNDIAGIAMDIKAGKSLPQIMLSWECGHETVRRVKNAIKLVDGKASPVDVYKALEECRITSGIAEWANNEIYKQIEDEKKELAETTFVNNAIGLEKSSDFSINEIGYTLMRIESLLEEVLKVWKV